MKMLTEPSSETETKTRASEEMSLYQRKDTEGNLNSPYWYCEFNDGGKAVRKSTEVKIATRTVKAFEKSQAAARQQEALIKAEYFKEKKELPRTPTLRQMRLFKNSPKSSLNGLR